MRECPKCEGSGLMELDLHEEDFMNSNAIDPLTECDMCGGTGEIPSTMADKIRNMSDDELAKLLIKAMMFFEMDSELSTSQALEKAMNTDEKINMFLMFEVIAWLKQEM